MCVLWVWLADIEEFVCVHMGVWSEKGVSIVWLTQHTSCAFRAQILTRTHNSQALLYKKTNSYDSWVGLLLSVYIAGFLHSCMHICVYKHKQTSNCAGWLDFQGMVSGSYELVRPYSVRERQTFWQASRPDLQTYRQTYRQALRPDRPAGRQRDRLTT